MRTPIAELAVGTYVDDIFLVTDYRRLQNRRTGRDGIKWTVRDVTGTITVIVWATTDEHLKYGHEWKTMRVSGNVEPDTYAGTGALQIKADAVYFEAPATLEGLEPVTTMPIASYTMALDGYIRVLRSPLRELVQAVFAQPGVQANFYHIGAGKSMHHAVRGGLLQHTVEVARITAAMVDALKESIDLNRDLAVAGAILHDVGKVDELEGDGAAIDYGVMSMIGHITCGQFRIRDAAATIPDFPQDLLRELLHIVGAHHGAKDKGSPVEAAFMEADIVHLADQASAFASARRERLERGGQLFERHPMLTGGQFTGPRFAFTLGSEPEPQPDLFTEIRERAGRPKSLAPVAPAVASTAPASRMADNDLDDPFADS